MFFSLSIDTLRNLPDAISVDKGLVTIDNTNSPHITLLTEAWKGTPAQLDATMTIFCTEGQIEVRIALEHHVIKKDSVCIITPGTVVEVLSVTQDFHCITIVMAKDYMNLSQEYTQQILLLFKYVQRQPCYHLEGHYAERYHHTIMEMLATARWEDNPLRIRMMYCYAYLLFCCVYPIMETKEEEYREFKSITHQKEIYFRFMELVQACYREHRTVEYYAKRMELTPKYLSKVVNQESGTTALKWIENYVVLEAKALLKQSDMNVLQVSQRLHFPDQNTFGKFFKRCVGVSPKDYRTM